MTNSCVDSPITGNSQDTKVSDSFSDSEMVSEDESSRPVQSEVTNAGEVSGEESHGPKLIEQPTTVDMVIEEEPTTNNTKRKIEDTNNVTDVNDLPSKKSRPDSGKFSGSHEPKNMSLCMIANDNNLKIPMI